MLKKKISKEENIQIEINNTFIRDNNDKNIKRIN